MDIVNRHTTVARWTGSSTPTSRARRSLASMTLGDLGAEVVKLERPEVGHETRSRQPPNSDDGQSTYYLAVNRNRRSLTLDLSTSDGCAAATRLATPADIAVAMRHRNSAELGARAAPSLTSSPELAPGFRVDPGFPWIRASAWIRFTRGARTG